MARLSSSRWSAVRKQVLDRDGWRCQKCGKAGRLEVHHVRERRHGGDPYDPDGCQTLCVSCHLNEHRTRRPPAEWAKLVRDTLNETPERKETEVRKHDAKTED